MIEVRPRFTSHLKKHMIRINKNIYIGASDPQFHEKVLKYMDPSSPYYEAAKRKMAQHSKKEASFENTLNSTKPAGTRTTLFLFMMLILALISLLLLFSGSYSLEKNTVHAGDPAIIINHAEYVDVSPLHYVGANFVRTALNHYIDTNGNPPPSIAELTRDYPNNYMSFIPVEAMSGSNVTVPIYNGQGGWVYNPKATSMAAMFYPNVAPFNSKEALSLIPFEPISAVVHKNSFTLTLVTGSYMLETMPVGIGNENRTPESTFIITDRVLEPIGAAPLVYGAAGLGFGDYAIHGTYDEASISAEMSLGCIRMTNDDVLALYPLMPKGTVVNIKAGSVDDDPALLPVYVKSIIPEAYNQLYEDRPKAQFNWLG